MEIACNHASNLDRFDSYLKICKDIGNISIKYQIYNSDFLCHHSYKYLEDLKNVEINHNKWNYIIKETLKKDIDLWLEPFEESSLDFIIKLNLMNKISIKIPSCDVPLVKPNILKNFKMVGIAIGGLDLKELKEYIPKFKKHIDNLYLFHGYQAFPTSVNDTNFERMLFIKKFFNLPVIYADHTENCNDQEILNVIQDSFHYGAEAIEKHICLDYKDKYDAISASDPKQFKKINSHLNDLKNSNFMKYERETIPNMSPSEKKYRDTMLKKVISTKIINPGELITKDKICFQRANSYDYIHSSKIISLIDSNQKLVAKKIIGFGEILSESQFEIK